eukprot:gene15068-biopygen9213
MAVQWDNVGGTSRSAGGLSRPARSGGLGWRPWRPVAARSSLVAARGAPWRPRWRPAWPIWRPAGGPRCSLSGPWRILAAMETLTARAGGPGGLLTASLTALAASGGLRWRPVAALATLAVSWRPLQHWVGRKVNRFCSKVNG